MRGRNFGRGGGIVLLIVLVGTGLLFGGPIYRWARVKHLWQRTDFNHAPDTIWRSTLLRRTGEPFESSVVEGWSAETGIRVILWEDVVDGQYQFYTYWDTDGEIVRQARSFGAGTTKFRKEPPWWNGKVAEVEPTAPWLEEGLTADQWWEGVRSR